jgi:hypothetical protein
MTGMTRRWLLLVHQVPPKPDYLRVKVRRRLQRLGAVAIKSTVYTLPRTDQALEDFEWVLREIVEAGGQGAICEAAFVGGLSDVEVERLFREERAAEYGEIVRAGQALLENAAGEDNRAEVSNALARLRKRHEDVRAIDFVGAPEASAAERVLRDIEHQLAHGESAANPNELNTREHPRARTWVTRKGVYIDRIASAWLIRRFIDPKSKFKFVAGRAYKPKQDELRFDMFEGEYTHEGERCTFEVLLERFQLRDPALSTIGEIVHDLDLKDEKHRRPETAGIEQVIAGIAMAHKDDDVRIERGCTVLDDLHVYLTKKAPKRGASKNAEH